MRAQYKAEEGKEMSVLPKRGKIMVDYFFIVAVSYYK